MRVRTRLAIAAAALAAAIAPGVAQAAPDTVVNFDDLPTGTAPGHYYENTAGVQFGIPADFGLPAYGTDRCNVRARLDRGGHQRQVADVRLLHGRRARQLGLPGGDQLPRGAPRRSASGCGRPTTAPVP